MKVVTLDSEKFADSCRCLAAMVEQGGFSPDVLVGIRTGGEHVARAMLPAFFKAPRMECVELRRPTTASKSRVRGLLSRLPRCVADLLRIVESKVLSMRNPRRRPFDNLPQSLRSLAGARVLIVDDAVDSGATMLAVTEAIRAANPQARVMTAAITLTTRRPLIAPDYSLFKTLVRFPWSMDAR